MHRAVHVQILRRLSNPYVLLKIVSLNFDCAVLYLKNVPLFGSPKLVHITYSLDHSRSMLLAIFVRAEELSVPLLDLHIIRTAERPTYGATVRPSASRSFIRSLASRAPSLRRHARNTMPG